MTEYNFETVLLNTVENGNVAYLEDLIETGLDLRNYNFDDLNLLEIAVLNNQYEVVKLLLEHDFNIDAQDEYRNTCLLLAVTYSNYEIAKLLIQAYADVNIVDEDGNSALALAKGNNELIDLLNEHCASEFKLHSAAAGNRIDEVKSLIESGADVDEKDSVGVTALHLAAKNGNYEVVKLLLEAGASVDNKAEFLGFAYDSCTEICWCVSSFNSKKQDDYYKTVKLLLDAGAEANFEFCTGESLLDAARVLCDEKIVKLLEENGAE